VDRRLIESGLALSSELSLTTVLQRIVELAVEITGARYGALGVIGPDGRVSEFRTTGVDDETREAIGDPPVGRGILGVLMEESRSLRLEDLRSHPRSVGFPPHHPDMSSFLGTPIVVRGTVFGDIYLTEKQTGPAFTEEDQEAIEVLAAQAGVAIENARIYAESRRNERMLEAFREIAISILSGAASDEALALIARRAMELVGADLASVAALDHVGLLTLRVAEGVHAEELRGSTFPPRGSISGEVIRSGRAIVVPDASREPRAYQPVVRLGEMGPMILVPLSEGSRAIGTLNAVRVRGGRPFDQADVDLLQRLADQAAIALEYARAQNEAQRVAILEDRERIAKELHDGVIQALFAVGMGLQGTALGSSDRDLASRVEGSVAELDRVIRDLRNYIFGLRPGILADRQLDQALRQTAQEFESRSGVLTVVEIDETVAAELASSAADVIQATREALSNVGRHAEATTCRVSLHREDGSAVLEIDDDGKGFDPEAGRRGDGLTNLEQRAEALGGKTSIQSAPTQGTTVRISIPL
jgi:two-component system, NarL family, sensor histidine kinase DevS